MAFKTSTGLRNGMLTSNSLRQQLLDGFINVYSGPAPASADHEATGTLLWVISLNATTTGVSLDATPLNGVISKPSEAVWSGNVLVTGVAGYYRHVGSADTGIDSLSDPRVQGSISTIGAEMNLSNPSLTSGSVKALDNYTIQFPTF